MSLAKLRTHTFSSAEDLCRFVNDCEISVIEQIVIRAGLYVLFYR